MNEINVAIAALGLLIMGLGLMTDDYREYDSQATNYCEMVELHKTSGGENGWPDYNGNYSEVCE